MARTCDAATNAENATKGAARHKLYAPVPVLITETDLANETITFMARAGDGTIKTCTAVPWADDDMWTECPSSLDASPTTLPAINATGVLYLSADRVNALNLAATPKWPNALEKAPEAPLRIWPTKIVIGGYQLDYNQPDYAHRYAEIDLLDPKYAATALDAEPQTLTLDGSAQTLLLRQAGFAKFKLNLPTIGELQAAVEAIEARKDPRRILAAWATVNAYVARVPSTAINAEAQVLLDRVLARS